MKRIGFAVIIGLTLASFGCRSHQAPEERHHKKDCKEKCKGMKGKDRADCNKACN